MRPKHFMSCLITSVVVTLVIISLYGDTEANEFLYMRRAEDIDVTVSGVSKMIKDVTRVRCAMICAVTSCLSFTWQSGTCVAFSSIDELSIGVILYKTQLNHEIYLRSDQLKFVIALERNNDLTWNMAKAECEKMGEKLLYIPDATNLIEATNKFGQLYIGVTQDGAGSGPYTTLDGEVVTLSPWFAGQPDFMDGDQHCIMYWKNAGYEDVHCYSRFDPACATISLCTYTQDD